MRIFEKAGYSCEGRLRKSVTKDGQTIDQMLYATVRERGLVNAQDGWASVCPLTPTRTRTRPGTRWQMGLRFMQ